MSDIPAGTVEDNLLPLAAITVNPGDVLVIVLSADATSEQLEHFADEASERLPQIKGRVMFVAGIEGLAVVKAKHAVTEG